MKVILDMATGIVLASFFSLKSRVYNLGFARTADFGKLFYSKSYRFQSNKFFAVKNSKLQLASEGSPLFGSSIYDVAKKGETYLNRKSFFGRMKRMMDKLIRERGKRQALYVQEKKLIVEIKKSTKQGYMVNASSTVVSATAMKTRVAKGEATGNEVGSFANTTRIDEGIDERNQRKQMVKKVDQGGFDFSKLSCSIMTHAWVSSP
ncbi:hypothetical protein Dimus_008734 [Dionaea muscipula]